MRIPFGRHLVDLSAPKVMGILNVTPDSFYDGGRYFRRGNDISTALTQAEAMLAAGATFIDIGGESTRPGAAPVSLQEEMDRVLPVVEALTGQLDCVISVDTSSAEVMKASAALGAGLINDVRALQRQGALAAASAAGLPVCLMHMLGQPQTMQEAPQYMDVVAQVRTFLDQRREACIRAGIDGRYLLLDPGFGFGKTDEHNLDLLRNLSRLRIDNLPIVVGLSRKSVLGRLLGRPPRDRLAGSLALAQYALQHGANILRVHDVEPTMDIVRMFQLINQGNQ